MVFHQLTSPLVRAELYISPELQLVKIGNGIELKLPVTEFE